MPREVVVALIAAVPATLAALAAWRSSQANKGLLVGIDASVNSRPASEPKLYDLVQQGHANLEGQIDGVHDRISALDAKLDTTARRIDDRINSVIDGTAGRSPDPQQEIA